MNDILHRIGATVPRDDVWAALTTIEGLAGWWTEDTTGDPAAGGTIRFRFAGADDAGGIGIEVVEAVPCEHLLWRVAEGPDEWIGTRIRFDLSEVDGYTIVRFRHEGWPAPGDFMHHCSTKWATFLMSLKALLEEGAGRPAPNDVRISDWH